MISVEPIDGVRIDVVRVVASLLTTEWERAASVASRSGGTVPTTARALLFAAEFGMAEVCWRRVRSSKGYYPNNPVAHYRAKAQV